MNIEELFDNEKWAGYGIVVTDDANQTIEYLKMEVMEYVAGLEKRIAELEAQVPKAARPTIICDGIWSFACGECQRPVNRDECYCVKCGAKLDWT